MCGFVKRLKSIEGKDDTKLKKSRNKKDDDESHVTGSRSNITRRKLTRRPLGRKTGSENRSAFFNSATIRPAPLPHSPRGGTILCLGRNYTEESVISAFFALYFLKCVGSFGPKSEEDYTIKNAWKFFAKTRSIALCDKNMTKLSNEMGIVPQPAKTVRGCWNTMRNRGMG